MDTGDVDHRRRTQKVETITLEVYLGDQWEMTSRDLRWNGGKAGEGGGGGRGVRHPTYPQVPTSSLASRKNYVSK